MMRTAEDRATNRKLTAITKGPHHFLDRLKVMMDEWLFSPAQREIYRYADGVFEAYPSAGDGAYYTHHSLRVPGKDARPVAVKRMTDPPRWKITERFDRAPEWKEVTSQDEIEEITMRRNKRHLQQTSIEQGASTREPLTTMRENFGFNDMSRKVLEGTYEFKEDDTEEFKAFIKALERTDKEKACTPVLGALTSAEFQGIFSAKPAKTSSDTRTLSYTVWKCIAKSNFLSSIFSILISLPFTWGFVNDLWSHMTDFMIRKKEGSIEVNLLRIIGKVAADLNGPLGYLLGRKAAENFEACDPCEEQHGSRPNMGSPDAAMIKLLTFECTRMMREGGAFIQHDCCAHFDRIYPANTNVYASKYGVSQELLTSVAKTIKRMKRNVETARGVSEGTYEDIEGEPEMNGMIQGKADVPQLATQQSDVCMKAHRSIAPGFHLVGANPSREIKHHNIAIVDDADGHVSSDSDTDDEIDNVTTKLQDSGQKWNNILELVGGLPALHKTNWQMIAYKEEKGSMKLVQHTDKTIRLEDGKGGYAIIQYKPPNEPNKGLGYQICPDGNQEPHHKATLESIEKMSKNCTGAYLTEREAKQVILQRYLPKMRYALITTSWSEKQCKAFDACIRRTFVPPMKLNRNYPSAVLFGLAEHGGMEFPSAYTLQDQVQLQYLIK